MAHQETYNLVTAGKPSLSLAIFKLVTWISDFLNVIACGTQLSTTVLSVLGVNCEIKNSCTATYKIMIAEHVYLGLTNAPYS